VCSVRMFFAAAEAQTYYCCVVKLHFFSSRFEYPDLFVSSRIAYPSKSYFSQKVTSEVFVSQRRRSPSAQSALPLTCALIRFAGFCYRYSQKARKKFWQKDFFQGKF
jgi:hypothetical protein